MIKSLKIFCVVLWLQGALAEVIYNYKQCPEIKKMKHFDLDKFLGVWHGIAKYPEQTTSVAPGVEGRNCVYTHYALLSTNLIAIDSYAIDTYTGEQVSDYRNAEVVGPGKFFIQDAPKNTLDLLNVLDTDYENYATLYACTYLDGFEYQIDAYIVGRNETMDVDSLLNAIKPLANLNLDLARLVPYSQEDCPPIPSVLLN